MNEPAAAKINLFLGITGRRPDGYHLLDSLVVFAGVADEIRATPSERLSLAIEGPFAAALTQNEDNLVLRAARALAAHANVASGAHITLIKNLPVASGIGGGSADAAATLRLLARHWNITSNLSDLALSLGADVPVCLASQPARMGGIGDQLAPAPALPPCGILLANPGLAVATAAVFKARRGGFSSAAVLSAAWPNVTALAADLAATTNDLQAPAIALCPPIADVLAAIEATRDCRFARMSGSGATCFGLYDSPQAAAAAAAQLARANWWCWGGALFRQDGGFAPLPYVPSAATCLPAM